MKRILIVDPFSSGHHIDYAKKAVESARSIGAEVFFIGDEKIIDSLEEECDKSFRVNVYLGGGFVKNEIQKFLFLYMVFKIAKKEYVDAIHFLYLDRFIRMLAILPLGINVKKLATLHWFYMLPQFNTTTKAKVFATLERILFWIVKKRGWIIIGHSKKAMKLLCDESHITLNYPADRIGLNSKDDVVGFRKYLGLKESDTLMLCFGGTRKDKGADYAIKILSNLPASVHLLVAGNEEEILYKDLFFQALNRKCEDRLHLIKGFVSDLELSNYFYAADIILTPYRPEFSGQSGPLTTAISIGKPVLSSNALVLKETIEGYSGGACFEFGNMESAIESYNKCTKTIVDSDEFCEQHSSDNFTKSLSLIYSKVLSETK